MGSYHGEDNSGAPTTGAYIPGKGYWVTATTPEDSSPRDTASATIAAEAAMDRSVWIAWRMVNGLEGSPDGAPYPGDIDWNGKHRFLGTSANTYFARGITVDSGASSFKAIDVAGAATLSGGVSIPAGSVLQLAEKTVQSGDAGYRELRESAGPNADATIQIWKTDLLVAPAITANRSWTLAKPPLDAVVESRIFIPSVGHNLTLYSQGGVTPLYTYTAGDNSTMLTVLYIGSLGYWFISAAYHP